MYLLLFNRPTWVSRLYLSIQTTMPPARLAVVGAGVVGLSCAVQLQKELPRASVTIIADRLNEDTVSDGAAGSFRPTGDLLQGLGLPRDTLL